MAVLVVTKRCSKCGVEKALEEFNRNGGTGDGMRGDCKVCRRAARHEWYTANSEKVRASSRKWREENRERVRIKDREWKAKNPEKVQHHEHR